MIDIGALMFAIRRDEGASPKRAATGSRRGRKPSPEITELVEHIKAGVPGKHSWFFPGLTAKDVEFLRRPCLREGVGIQIHEVERDEIYFQPGVRVFRVEGEYDEL